MINNLTKMSSNGKIESVETKEVLHHGNRRNLYLITLCVSLAFMALGVSSGWPTPVLLKFRNNETNVDINKDEVAMMFSLYPVGFSTGSLATRYIADRLGRRATILGSAVPIVIGSVIVVFALKAWLLYITAFTWQCGTGMLSTVIGIYLSEVADKDIRGTLQLITGFTFKLGNLLAMVVGPFLSYNALNLIMVALPVGFFLICWWIPETPYFCLKKDNLEAARKSLRMLRKYNDEKILEDELLALQADVHNEMSHSSSFKELFTGPQYRKAIVIAIGLKVAQIMTGGVVIRQYLSWIIAETELKMEMSLVLIIYGSITFVVGLMSSALVDRVGRRPLLIYSYFGTGMCLGTITGYFFFQDVVRVDHAILTTYSFIPLLSIILSNVISTLGYNSLIHLVPAEIFPINVKAIAITCLNIFGAAIAVLVAQGYQKVKDYCGLTTIFCIFTAFAIGGGIFSYFLVIETKGKKLSDIQAELQGNAYKVVAVNDTIDVGQENVEDTELTELKPNDKNV